MSSEPASSHYELVVDHAERGGPSTGLGARLLRLFGGTPHESVGVRVFSLNERATGRQVLRHIEDWDDDDHLYDRIATDLAELTVDEFATRWD